MKRYQVLYCETAPDLNGAWESDFWKNISVANIDTVRPESSSHHPRTALKLVYTQEGFYGLFQVEDQYIRAVAKQNHDAVCCDSCVEFFIQPQPLEKGYFNLEMNCSGKMLCFYITKWNFGPQEYVKLSDAHCAAIQRVPTLPPLIEEEITTPTTWRLGFHLPFAVLQSYREMGEIQRGTIWRCNFYKCADKCSHPHWESWNPVTRLAFHNPPDFGELEFC